MTGMDNIMQERIVEKYRGFPIFHDNAGNYYVKNIIADSRDNAGCVFAIDKWYKKIKENLYWVLCSGDIEYKHGRLWVEFGEKNENNKLFHNGHPGYIISEETGVLFEYRFTRCGALEGYYFFGSDELMDNNIQPPTLVVRFDD